MRLRALPRAAAMAALGSLLVTSMCAGLPVGAIGTALAAGPVRSADSAGTTAAAASVSVSGPSTLSRPSAYAVTAAGGTTKVCRVQELSTGLADHTAPFAIRLDLSRLAPGTRTLKFASVDCDGYIIATTSKVITVPVRVTTQNTAWVAPSASDPALRQLSISVQGQQAPVTAKVLRGSTVVATLPPRPGTKASWTWKPGSAAAGSYTVAVSSGGASASLPFGVARGWAPMGPAFERCTTITWTYSSAGQPKKAAGMEADVVSAFARIHTATGITFTQVSSGGKIALGWKKLSGEDGLGGSTSQNGVAIKGQVWFGTGSEWVGHKGFGHDGSGFPGRGGLITHEVSHALGLGHVTDQKQVMYPIATNGSPTVLASGDKAGLKALYRTAAC